MMFFAYWKLTCSYQLDYIGDALPVGEFNIISSIHQPLITLKSNQYINTTIQQCAHKSQAHIYFITQLKKQKEENISIIPHTPDKLLLQNKYPYGSWLAPLRSYLREVKG